MSSPLKNSRLWLVALGLCLGFLGMASRLVYLQVYRHDELSEKAQANTARTDYFDARRGDIRDVRGNLLATSEPAKKVCADPTLIGNAGPTVARALAPILRLPEADLARRLQPTLRTNAAGHVFTNQYVELRRKVPLDVWAKVQQAMTQLPAGIDEATATRDQRQFIRNLREKAIFAREDQVRVYPNQQLAAHLLGFLGRDKDGHDIGLEGIEYRWDSKLRGTPGLRMTEADRRNRELVWLREQEVEPQDGLNVVLTIDSGLQNIVEQEMQEAVKAHTPESLSVVVVRPRTGEVLAMANYPTFNPNDPGSAPAASRRNRAITDLIEPGSTFKVVVVSGGLNEKAVRPTDTFNCENGRFFYAGKYLHDDHPCGVLTVQQIIAKSSNIGAAKVGIKLGKETLYDYIRRFGFGDRTGIYLMGESRGIVNPPRSWYPIDISRIPMGHSVSVTPIQMTMAMASIANGGKLMRPYVVQRVEDSQGKVLFREEPQTVRQVISPATAAEMIKALEMVVSTNGTAAKAKLDHYTVAGKTGTAQKVSPTGHGYVDGQYITSFIGFFPSRNPELCISVIFDHPRNGKYGGLVAAPVFKRIADRAGNYLNIPADLVDPKEENQHETLMRRLPPAPARIVLP